MDGDINVDQTVVTNVKVRKPSDIMRMPPSNYRLCVKPHPSLSNEVKREITEKINNFFPNIGIYSGENEGDLDLIQSGCICVIHKMTFSMLPLLEDQEKPFFWRLNSTRKNLTQR